MIVNREQGREYDRQQGKRERNSGKGRGGKRMHRLGKKGTYISHKHHRLLLEGTREGKSGKGIGGREQREGNTRMEHIISTELNSNICETLVGCMH